MLITNEDIEECVIAAYVWLDAQKKPNYVKAVRLYSVHKDRVRRWYHGITNDSSYISGHNKRLNCDEDKALCAYIDLADDIGLPIRKKTLVVAANSILQNHYPDAPSVSRS
jgi:hypothetical protein